MESFWVKEDGEEIRRAPGFREYYVRIVLFRSSSFHPMFCSHVQTKTDSIEFAWYRVCLDDIGDRFSKWNNGPGSVTRFM
jgi:hypothetical protein